MFQRSSCGICTPKPSTRYRLYTHTWKGSLSHLGSQYGLLYTEAKIRLPHVDFQPRLKLWQLRRNICSGYGGTSPHLQDTLRINHGKHVAFSHLESRCTHIEHIKHTKCHSFITCMPKKEKGERRATACWLRVAPLINTTRVHKAILF